MCILSSDEEEINFDGIMALLNFAILGSFLASYRLWSLYNIFFHSLQWVLFKLYRHVAGLGGGGLITNVHVAFLYKLIFIELGPLESFNAPVTIVRGH